MILVDTNVFVDLWTNDREWGEWSADALTRAADEAPLAINPIIYAELCLGFATETQLAKALDGAGIRRLALPYAAAWLAARAFLAYRKRGGQRTAAAPGLLHRRARRGRGADPPDTRRRALPHHFPQVSLIAPPQRKRAD